MACLLTFASERMKNQNNTRREGVRRGHKWAGIYNRIIDAGPYKQG